MRLVEAEGDFDRYDRGHNFAVRAYRWFEFPAFDRFDGFFFQTETGPLHDGDVNGATIGGDSDLQYDRTLIFRFARLVRILWDGAVQANGHADTVDACAKCAATRATTFARSETATRAAADSRAVAMSKRIRVRGS